VQTQTYSHRGVRVGLGHDAPTPTERTQHAMKLFSHAIWIARTEARFFLRYPKLLIATVLVAALPSLYGT